METLIQMDDGAACSMLPLTGRLYPPPGSGVQALSEVINAVLLSAVRNLISCALRKPNTLAFT